MLRAKQASDREVKDQPELDSCGKGEYESHVTDRGETYEDACHP